MNQKLILPLIFSITFFFSPSPAQASATCPGDANADNLVDLSDFSILASQYLQRGPNLISDFNQDQLVDLSDFSILATHFLNRCSTDSNRPVPVLSVAYYPLKDGKLDTQTVIQDTYGEYDLTLDEVRFHVANLIPLVESALETGSTFHGYKNSSAKPFLDYQIISHQEIHEAVPLSDLTYNGLPLPDYLSMMNRLNVCDYVDNLGVREIWLWTYAGTGKSGWESNMSSIYGDISNSTRNPNDLPACNHSYTVYDYNYGRGVSEAIEDHMHQFEAIFRFIDRTLFWEKFVGYYPGYTIQDTRRRCGWAHFPPNGIKDYDWANQTPVTTDCESWNPDSYGPTITINCTHWNCNSLDFFIWWMQNLPGEGNPYTYQGRPLRNWWLFISDFDQIMQQGLSLTH